MKKSHLTNFVIFGATGDLAKNYLFSALFRLHQQGLSFNNIGFGRSQLNSPQFQSLVNQSVGNLPFSKSFQYFSGQYDTSGLSALVGQISSHTVYYLALPIDLKIVDDIITGLIHHHLFQPSHSKLVIEKPFGHDYHSAQQLINLLNAKIGHESVFLVDHYLTKELVRNIISLRFANPIFDHLWNSNFIEGINITAIEDRGVGSRAQYYDHVGAVKDMVQNHCLQLLSLIIMDRPTSLSSADFIAKKVDVFQHLRLFSGYQPSVHLGQYLGYLAEPGVQPSSTTETSAQIIFKSTQSNWRGVPLTITTGKKKGQQLTQIEIIFRKQSQCLWGKECHRLSPNRLIINLSPDNDIKLIINSEFNPHRYLPSPTTLKLGSIDPDQISTSPYQNVISDICEGNRLNSPSFEEILMQWRIIDRITKSPNFGKKLDIY